MKSSVCILVCIITLAVSDSKPLTKARQGEKPCAEMSHYAGASTAPVAASRLAGGMPRGTEKTLRWNGRRRWKLWGKFC
jgi:hypothetical protein